MIFHSAHPYLSYLKLLTLIVLISLVITILKKRKKPDLIIFSDKKEEKLMNLHKISSNNFEIRSINEIKDIKRKFRRVIYISFSRSRLYRDLKILEKYQEYFNELYVVHSGKIPKSFIKNFKRPVFHLKKINSIDF